MRFSRMITAVDAHAAGMHGRVVIGGVGALNVPGASMFEKKRYLEQHGDDFRRFDVIEGTLFHAPPRNPANSSRSAVVVPSPVRRREHTRAILDRSPCGTGTSAQIAALHARGRAKVGDELRQEGILDTIFTARIAGEARVGTRTAVVPTIRGRAWISAFAQYVLAPDDPFPEGFMVGDVWPM